MTGIDLTAAIRPTSDAIYRQLSGHASSCLTLFGVDAQIAADPCAYGLHRWAWLTSGRQACGVCGKERR